MNILAHYMYDDALKVQQELKSDLTEIVRSQVQETLQRMINEEFLDFIESMMSSSTKDYRNGSYTRKLQSKSGEIEISIPRDRVGLYQTALVKRYSRTIDDVEGLIQTLYLKGLSYNDIVMEIEELTGHSMSRVTIAKIVKQMVESAECFRNRQIPDCSIVYLDGTYVPFKNVNTDGTRYVIDECIEVAVGVTPEGRKMVLGYFIHPNEGKRSWVSAMEDLKKRGLTNPCIFITDGLNGMDDAIREVFPSAKHQRCLVHVTRNLVTDSCLKDRKAIAEDFRHVYDKDVTTCEEFQKRLSAFISKWQVAYPKRMRLLAQTKDLSTYLEFPAAIRSALYTTNQIESVNSMIKTETKKRRLINSEENGIIVLASAFVKYEHRNRRINGFSELTEEEKTRMRFIV